jgi:hypothetical protein
MMRGYMLVTSILAATVVALGAPSFVCEASAPNKPLIRAEGLTESVGDLLLRCHGQRPMQPMKILVYFNSQFTSNVISGQTTDALLTVEKPGSPFRFSDIRLNQNAFHGILQAPNALLWNEVPLPPSDPFDVQFRITNLRINAAGLGVSATKVPAKAVLYAIVGTTNEDTLKTQETVAYVAASLATSVRTCDDMSQVSTLEFFDTTAENEDLLGPRPTAKMNMNLKFSETESFTDVFTSRASGTKVRLMARFTNIGKNVRLYVTTRPNQAGTTSSVDAELIAADQFGGGPTRVLLPVANGSCGGRSIGLVPLTIEHYQATAVWEINKSSPSIQEEVSFGVAVVFGAAPGPNAPSLGTATVSLALAPAYVAYRPGIPVPAYAVSTDAPKNAFRITRKRTWILFSDVTNMTGHDTGMIIENTSKLEGRCLIVYGAKLPNGAVPFMTREETDRELTPGDRIELRLSVGGNYGLRGNPNIGGCVLAACDFPVSKTEQILYDGPDRVIGRRTPRIFESAAEALAFKTSGCDSDLLQRSLRGLR